MYLQPRGDLGTSHLRGLIEIPSARLNQCAVPPSGWCFHPQQESAHLVSGVSLWGGA